MDDINLEEFSVGLVEFFGDNLANPEREPKRFRWQCRFYKYIMGPKAQTNSQKE